MTNFLKFMIVFWAIAIIVCFFSKCYVALILASVFLLKTISDLKYQKEYEAVSKNLEREKGYIEAALNELKRRNND